METSRKCPYFYRCQTFEFESDHACSLQHDKDCHTSGENYAICPTYKDKQTQDLLDMVSSNSNLIAEPNGQRFYVVVNDYCGRSTYTDAVDYNEWFITRHVYDWMHEPYDFKYWRSNVLFWGSKEDCVKYITSASRPVKLGYDEDTVVESNKESKYCPTLPFYIAKNGNIYTVRVVSTEKDAEKANMTDFFAGWYHSSEEAGNMLKLVAPYRVVAGFLWQSDPYTLSSDFTHKPPYVEPNDENISRSSSVLFEGTRKQCDKFLEDLMTKNNFPQKESKQPQSDLFDGLTDEQIQNIKALSEKYKDNNKLSSMTLLEKAIKVSVSNSYKGSASNEDKEAIFIEGVNWLADEMLYNTSDSENTKIGEMLKSFGIDTANLPLHTGQPTPYSEIHAVVSDK